MKSISGFKRKFFIDRAFFLLAFSLFFLSMADAVFGQDITIETDTAWNAGTYTYDNVLISNGATLIFDGAVTLNANNLTINAASSISSEGRGYSGGNGPGAGSDWLGGGAGHGGHGGAGTGGGAGGTYDSPEFPEEMGSGGGIYLGGCGFPTVDKGTPGGGAIKLTVGGTLRVDGVITANGVSYSGPCDTRTGGGSGGSINITASDITGTGSITANGGNVNVAGNAGGGGGGRIAIYYDTNSFIGTISTYGGSGRQYGGPGTAYMKSSSQNAADLFIYSVGDDKSAETPFEGVFNNVVLKGNMSLKQDGAVSISNLTVDSGSILLQQGYSLFISTLALKSGATLSHPANSDSQLNILDLIVADSLVIEAGASINVDGKGFSGGKGPGGGADSLGGGAGHGGEGGAGSGGGAGGTYGSAEFPEEVGSGGGIYLGGCGFPTVDKGTSGGGAIKLTVGGTLRVDGVITANGVSYSGPCDTRTGGGSGGSIKITASDITGTGSITANGGNVNVAGNAGGGGGGRVAVYYEEASFTGNVEIFGGTGINSGKNGTFIMTKSFVPTQITLGQDVNGSFTANRERQYFIVNVPSRGHLRINLNDLDNLGINEVYVRRGSLPTPGSYDYRFNVSGANQSIFVPNAGAGDWYILVYNDSGPLPGDFTLQVDISYGIALESVSPTSVGNAGLAFFTISGAGFTPSNTVALVGSITLTASSVTYRSASELIAEFNLSGVTPGAYQLRVTSGADSDSLPVQITQAVGANLETRIIVPSRVGYHAVATVYVEFTNTGDVAMPAPLLSVTALQNDNPGALLTLDSSRIVQGFWTSAIPAGFANEVQFLGSGTVPGLLQPGESGRVPIYYAGWQQPWAFSYPPINWNLMVLKTDSPIAADWASLKEGMRPEYVRADAWDAVWDNFTTLAGPTWGGYLAMLDQNATYLNSIGAGTSDITTLLSFALRQADALNPIRYLASARDASMSAPGFGLSFSRAYAQPISRRYELGPLGRGWEHGWQWTLAKKSDGTVRITGMTGTPQIFQPDSRTAGVYFAAPGDHDVLTGLSGDRFSLRKPDGVLYLFRADGRLDYIEDTNGNRITCGYNGYQLVSLMHSSGQSLTLTYNGAGRITGITDSEGRQTIFAYDQSNEHLTSVTAYNGRTTLYTYVSGQEAALEHALQEIEFPDGSHRYFTYDNRGRLSTTSADGNAGLVTFSYDSAGTVTTTTALGDTSAFYFDDYGQILKSTNPLGYSVLIGLDKERNMTSITDPAGRIYEYEYNSRGNLVRFLDPNGGATRFTYTTDLNRLSLLADAKGNFTHYNYDTHGNLTSITYANGSSENWTYNAVGLPEQWTNRRGHPISIEWDASGRPTSKTYADSTTVDYTYDTKGNLIETTDSTGTTTYTYNAQEYLTSINYPGGQWLQFTYDIAGRRSSSLNQLGHRLDYHYDTVGRLASISDEASVSIVIYAYDAVGRLSRKDLGNGVYSAYQYDAAGQLLHLVNYQPGGVVLSSFDYTYDSQGRRTGMTILDGAWGYEYDDMGQLTRTVFTSNNPEKIANQDLTYMYDALGNRIQTIENGVTTPYTTNNLNQYTAVGDSTYTFDADGNLVQEVSGAGTTTYTYDDENRLIAVAKGSNTWNYIYDALGQRVASSENGAVTRFVIDPVGFGNVVGEYDNSGNLIAGYDHGFGLLSRSASGLAAYYTFDAIGSTSEITGDSANILNNYVYVPFGKIVLQAGSSPNPFQFVGSAGIMTESHGLSFMRARYYDANKGRFMQADPIGLIGGINPYAYALNTPVLFIDPSGLQGGDAQQPQEPWGAGFCFGPDRDCAYRQADNFKWWWDRAAWRHDIRMERARILLDLPKDDRNYLGHLRYWRNHYLLYLEIAEPWRQMVPLEPLVPAEPPTAPGEPGGDGSSGSSGSSDPNSLIGPSGYGAENFVEIAESLPYRINFENDASATAPAHEVTISNFLSADFDSTTFELTEIAFGDHFIAVPAGTQHFTTVEQMTFNGGTFDVHIEAGIRLTTGEVYANFQSLDPITGLPPAVDIGFLPQEDGTGRGQGHISYVVKSKEDLPTGTEIRNIANIVFDGQPAIATNQVDPHDPSQGTDPAKEAPVTIWNGVFPTVTTGAATDVTPTSATLNGAVNPVGLTSTAEFEYGLTTAYGNTASVTLSPINGSTMQNVSAAISGLDAHMTYHCRLTVTNSFGTWLGNDVTFTTSLLPILTSLEITGPATVNEGFSATYEATATWSDGTTASVTPTWSVSPTTFAAITSAGVLQTQDVPADQNVTVSASYTDNEITKSADKMVTIKVDNREPSVVTISGRQLSVNGSPFTVKGVGYSPTPIGDDPETMPLYGDYFTASYSDIYERDLPLLRDMGTNTIRLWGWNNTADHLDFLDKAYNDGVDPIYVIVGFWINSGLDIDPLSPDNVREQLKADFMEMVAIHKNHPAILMWTIGNELNAPWMYGGQLDDLMSLINEMAAEAHAEEGSNYHPVTTPFADVNLINTVASYDASAPSIDIWGANVYRGDTFGNLFGDYEAVSTKPLIILEYGIDAYDNVQGDEYEKIGVPYQADYAESLWFEMEANANVCIGGTIMVCSDEWWKGKYSTDLGCPDYNPAFHSICGYASTAHPDGYSNEEWWGLMRTIENGAEPDIVEPRAVYYKLQSLWGSSQYMGDINKDGQVDISDVILVLRIALGLDPEKPCSNINGDGVVDISDVILTLRTALGLDQLKPCT